jgi:hypothetical protein
VELSTKESKVLRKLLGGLCPADAKEIFSMTDEEIKVSDILCKGFDDYWRRCYEGINRVGG